MSVFPQKPRTGEKVLQGLYNSVCQIIDYLPTLEVRGDNNSTSVTKTSNGTIIHASNNNNKLSQSKRYISNHGIALLEDTCFISVLTGGRYITVDYYEQNEQGEQVLKDWPTINCMLSGGTDIQITPQGVINYTGSGGGGGGYEYFDGRFISISSDYTINCTLSGLNELYNPPIISDTFPLSSEISTTFVYPDHFMQFRDWIGNKGQNTIVTSGSFINTHRGAGEPGSWEYIFQYTGPQVDCLLTGGRFIDVHSHWQDSGGETPEQQEPDDHTINSLLSGDNQHIFISQQVPNSNGSWGGIISTNIHGDETTIHMAEDGTLSAIGGGGGGGGDFDWPNYDNLGEESDTRVYPLMRYTTSTGGWLRVSCKGGTSRCVGVWIDDNYVGLGQGIMTWPLAIPPGCSFYVDVDWSLNNLIWFDSTVTPGTVTNQQYDYWFIPPQWDPNRSTISDARNTFDNARSQESYCYNFMTGAANDLRQMSSNWTKLTMISGSDPDAEPYSREWYQDQITSMQKKLSGDQDDNGCDYYWDEAITYCQQLNTLNTSLPSANPMYTYQVTDIPARCQQYYGKIEQYITSGQYYYNLVDQWWTQHDQQNQ